MSLSLNIGALNASVPSPSISPAELANDLLHKQLKDNPSLILAGSALLCISLWKYAQARKKDVNAPAIGPSGRLTSYLGAIKALTKSREMLEEGYKKYSTFKLPLFNRWLVVINTPELIEEIRKAPDDKFSFTEIIEDTLASRYTMGPLICANAYHVGLVRSQLTRSLGTLFSDVYDEVSQAFEDNIPAKSDEWLSLNAHEMVMQIVARTISRVFVGLPVCRNKDWVELTIQYTMHVPIDAVLINMVPDFLKKFAGEFLWALPRGTRRALKHLQPIIEYRISQAEKFGKDWPGKPNDMLSWLMDDGPEDEKRDAKALTHRILALNFAAFHTSCMSFTHALLHLAVRPEDVKLLREEVESVVRDEGWSKASLARMRRVDSYIKEVLRFDGIGYLSLLRKVLKDYTLSDGTFLPAGTHIACNSVSTHYDETFYPNAREFDGLRFASKSGSSAYPSSSLLGEEKGKGEGEEEEEEKNGEREMRSVKDRAVSTSSHFLTFGHGRHACPGRFFAVNELKTMLAYTVMNYDLQLDAAPSESNDSRDAGGSEGEKGTVKEPKTLSFATVTIPDPKARVLFRRRTVGESS